MGKLVLDEVQRRIFDEFRQNQDLCRQFYFTGGTALSSYYFHHRYSEDLDFFSTGKFPHELVVSFMNQCKKKLDFSATFRIPEAFHIIIYELIFKDTKRLKVDFNVYPFELLEKGPTVEGVVIDSLRDIGANKLMTINQRTEVKDFVDLYYLMKKFTIWDLTYAVEAKFGAKQDLVMLASDILKVEGFSYMPRMIESLTLPELQSYFVGLSKKIARRFV